MVLAVIHELLHNLIATKSKKGSRSYKKLAKLAFKNMSEAEQNKIRDKYEGYYKEAVEQGKVTEAEVKEIVDEEIVTHYAETLTNKAFLRELFKEDSTIGERIIDFFAKAKDDYAKSEKLSKSARKFLKAYKQMFDEFSAVNVNSNAYWQNTGYNLGDFFKDSIETAETDGNDGKHEVRSSSERLSLIGRTEDGRGIYRSNYPKNTPKAQKQKDIIDLVQNVWSKKPIKLNLIVDGKTVPIEASFNPELTERSDLSKIAFGNRKGTNSEKRITLDLSSDLYQIAEESHHVGSKTETGKDNPAHFGVSEWHYFLTNLVFVEDDGTNVDCYMNIDVKQNDIGHWFYSFAIEKGTAPRTLLAGVTEESATVPDNSISDIAEKINPSDEKSLEKLSLPDEETVSTADSVGKTRAKTELSAKSRISTWLENIYIQTVNETYGIEKFLGSDSSVGSYADVQALIQQARAASSKAQAMLGNEQYDVITGKRVGEGLSKIFERVEKLRREFDDYALHLLNIDRMTLSDRSIERNNKNLTELAEKESRRDSIEKRVAALEKRIKKLGRTKADMEIKNNLRESVSKHKTELRKLKKEITALHKLTDNFTALENKPVFGENEERAKTVTAEESRKIVEKYEKEHPEFKEVHKKLRAFLDNLLEMRVAAGLVSREDADRMKLYYPNYVPSFRDTSYPAVSPVKGKNNKEMQKICISF